MLRPYGRDLLLEQRLVDRMANVIPKRKEGSMQRASDQTSGRTLAEFDRQIREALIATYGEVQPPNSVWRRVVRRAIRLDRADYVLERREGPVLVT